MPKPKFFAVQESAEEAAARAEAVAAVGTSRRATYPQDVNVGQIDPNPYQARTEFTDLEELAAAIREQGFTSRLWARPHPTVRDRYQLAYGGRRLRAAVAAGLTTLPLEIGEFSNQQMYEIGLAENDQRVDLNPLDQARSYQLGRDEFGITIRDLARRIGRDKSYVEDRLAALRAPADVRDMVAERPASLRAAREIAKLPNPEQRAPLIAGVAAGRLTTQDVRTLGPQIAAGTGGSPAPPAAPPQARPGSAPAAVVQVRLVAADEATLTRALAALAATPGAALAFTPTRAPGRKGDWIAYGTLRWEEE